MAIPVIQSGYTEWTSTSAVTNIPLAQPSGITAGDLLVLIVGNEDSTGTPQFIDNVTDFDLQFEIGDGTSDNHLAVYTRIADETEEATTNVPTQSNDYAYGWYLRITGAHPTLFWDGNTSGQTQSSLPIAVTGRDTGVDDCLAFVFAGMDGADGGAGTVAGTGWSTWRALTTTGGSSGAAGVVGTKQMATAGPTGTATCDWSVSDGSAGIQFAIAPLTGPYISSVTPDEFDDLDTGVVIGGSAFGASKGSGKVELSDNAVYATGTKVEQSTTAWGDTSITFDVDLSTLGPGTRWIWVTDDGSLLSNGFEVTVHRAEAIEVSLSPNIATSGENTTGQLTPPASGSFGGGRIQDDENPTDAVDLDTNEYREDEWCLKATSDAEEAQYEFRVTLAGVPIDTYSVTPRVTFSAGVTLVIQGCAHAHTADSPALVQHHTLAIAETSHAHAADSPDLVQHHVLVIQEALHGHTADSLDLVEHQTLAINGCAHSHSADSLDLVQHHVLAIDEATHAHAAESPDLSEHQTLVIDGCLHSHTAENVSLLVHHVLAINEALHAHSAESLDLVEGKTLAINDALHAHSAESPTIVQHHVLSIDEALHSHAAENVVLSIAVVLVIQEAHHALVDDGPLRLCLFSHSDSWVGDGSNPGLNNLGFTLANNESVIPISFWGKIESNTVDQGFFEIWSFTSSLRLGIYWDASAKQFKLTGAGVGGTAELTWDASDMPSDLLDANGRPKNGIWIHYQFDFTGESGINPQYRINNVFAGTGTATRYPDQTTWGSSRVNIGGRRASDPLVSGGAICQLRIHRGWTDRATFINSVKWKHAIDDIAEPELYMGWNLEDDGTGTGSLPAPNVTLQNGAFVGGAGPCLEWTVDLVIQDAHHAHTADNVVLATSGVLEIQEALHAHAADNLDLVQAHTLAIDDALHSHAADNLDLVSGAVLEIQGSLHSHAVENVALVQHHVLAVDDALHGHTADSLDLVEGITLSIDSCLHSHTADALDLVEHKTLVIADCLHAHAADSPTLTQAHVLSIAECLHAHVAENVVLTTAGVLEIQACLHAHSAENVSLTQAHVLAIDDAAHAHAADQLDLAVTHILEIDEATHGHVADALDLLQHHSLTIDDCLHAHAAEQCDVIPQGAHVLEIQGATHGHTAENVSLSQAHVLAIADALHAHAAEEPTLSVTHILEIADALHTLVSENVDLVEHLTLEIQGAIHTHTADVIQLSQNHVLVIDDALHAHAADELSLVQHHVLVIDDCGHVHTVDSLDLAQFAYLEIDSCLHGHTATNIDLTQAHILEIQNALHAHSADSFTLGGADQFRSVQRIAATFDDQQVVQATIDERQVVQAEVSLRQIVKAKVKEE